MDVNVWDATDDLKAIVEPRRAIDIDRLADPSVSVRVICGADAVIRGRVSM